MEFEAFAPHFTALEGTSRVTNLQQRQDVQRHVGGIKSKLTDLINERDKATQELRLAHEALEMAFAPGETIKLTVGGECIEVKKEILEKHSPYFAALFASGMVEAQTGEIALDDSFTVAAVRAVIGSLCVSGGKHMFAADKLALADVLAMIVVASRWQLDTLFNTVVAAIDTFTSRRCAVGGGLHASNTLHVNSRFPAIHLSILVRSNKTKRTRIHVVCIVACDPIFRLDSVS